GPQQRIRHMTMRLALTGDSIIERRLNSRTDPELLPLFDLIRGADIAFTNLEVLPNDFRGHPAQESGGSHFGAPSLVTDELRDAASAPPTTRAVSRPTAGIGRRSCRSACSRETTLSGWTCTRSVLDWARPLTAAAAPACRPQQTARVSLPGWPTCRVRSEPSS